MAAYARVVGGQVMELFTPPTGFTIAECFAPGQGWVSAAANSNVAPGWLFDGTTFTAPPAPTPPPNPTLLGPLEFMNRFTSAEQSAIAAGAQANASLMLWMLRLSAAQVVDLTDPETKAGLDALVAAGLLTGARETAVLTP